MQRILLPLAIVAVLFYTPLFAVEQQSAALGSEVSSIDGDYFIGNAVGCLAQLKAPIGEECAFSGEFYGSPLVGQVITWAAMLALAAGVLGIIGLLPVVGRLTSIVTVLAGLGMLGAMGLMTLTLLGQEGGLSALRWGTYLTSGTALLTLISGLAGMRGDR